MFILSPFAVDLFFIPFCSYRSGLDRSFIDETSFDE
ncbi:unnamed protein product [Arabidopsis halleri]